MTAVAVPLRYSFSGIIDEIVDGDSVIATVIVAEAFHEQWRVQRSWRLNGCNARELRDPTGGGRAARDNLATILPAGTPVTIHSIKVDPYTDSKYESARYEASITLPDGTDLVTQLIAHQWAAPWDGTTQPRPEPPWPRIYT